MVTRTFPKTESIELSDDYAIVIPPSMREMLGIYPGQKLQLIVYEDQIILMPEVHPKELRGTLPDLDTNVERDEDRV